MLLGLPVNHMFILSHNHTGHMFVSCFCSESFNLKDLCCFSRYLKKLSVTLGPYVVNYCSILVQNDILTCLCKRHLTIKKKKIKTHGYYIKRIITWRRCNRTFIDQSSFASWNKLFPLYFSFLEFLIMFILLVSSEGATLIALI